MRIRTVEARQWPLTLAWQAVHIRCLFQPSTLAESFHSRNTFSLRHKPDCV